MSRILALHEIWLLVTGTRKADILDKMLEGPVTSDLPASYLHDHDGATAFATVLAMHRCERFFAGNGGPKRANQRLAGDSHVEHDIRQQSHTEGLPTK